MSNTEKQRYLELKSYFDNIKSNIINSEDTRAKELLLMDESYITDYLNTNDCEKYFEMRELEAILEIKDLATSGVPKKEIFSSMDFSISSIAKAGLGVSHLIPIEESINIEEAFLYSMPYEGKWEYFNGQYFGDNYVRDSLIISLISDAGLKHFLEILPKESIDILRALINSKEI